MYINIISKKRFSAMASRLVILVISLGARGLKIKVKVLLGTLQSKQIYFPSFIDSSSIGQNGSGMADAAVNLLFF
jgi:hypothetical protein